MVAPFLIRAGLSSGIILPSFPAPSAVISFASPFWTLANAYLDRTSGVADPASGTLAERYLSNNGTTTSQSRWCLGGFSIPASPGSGTYTASTTVTPNVIARRVGTSGRYLRMNLYDGTTIGGDAGCLFDLQAGTPASYRASGITESNAGMNNLGNGWFQCWFSFPIASTGDIAVHEIGITSLDNTNFDGNATVNVGDGFELFRYQIVTGTDPNG